MLDNGIEVEPSITSFNYDKNVNNNTKLLSKLDKICYYNDVNEITNKLIPLCLTVKNFSHPLCRLDDEKKTRLFAESFSLFIDPCKRYIAKTFRI
jgi:hypothetical protein